MTRDELIAAMRVTAAEKPTAVEVDGWGKVHIRALTVAEVEDQADDTSNGKDKNRIARGVARLLCDKEGKRLFDPDNASDENLLGSQPWRLLKQVIDASDVQQAKGTDAGK
jgi:hypothetical protein